MDVLNHFMTILLAIYFMGRCTFALDERETKLLDANDGEEIMSEGNYESIHSNKKTN